MKVLSLFSGGGLGDYGLELAGMEIAGQVEIDDYCQKILSLRWPDVPKWRDIQEFDGKAFVKEHGQPDIISGGFPCQPFSFAGKRRGKQDDRYLWPEMLRVISEIKPTFVLGENVPGIIKSALDTVLFDLETIGYTCQAFTIPACAVDAPHRRDRVWILAYCGYNGWCTKQGEQQEKRPEIFNAGGNGNVADTEGAKCQRVGRKTRTGGGKPRCGSWWQTEPNVGRVAHGIANRVDRLKLLGNGQVVQVVQWIGERIMEFETTKSKKEEGNG